MPMLTMTKATQKKLEDYGLLINQRKDGFQENKAFTKLKKAILSKDRMDKYIRDVDFECCINLTDTSAGFLAKIPRLRSVNFRDCEALTDAAAAHLATCAELESINFGGCRQLTGRSHSRPRCSAIAK